VDIHNEFFSIVITCDINLVCGEQMKPLLPIKIEDIPEYKNFVKKDTYILHPTGGYHFFKNVPNAKEKYKLPIWPYIEKIKDLKKGNKGIITPGIPINKSWYPYFNLEGTEKRKSDNRAVTKKVLVHRLVSFAYVPNLDRITKTKVNHINCDKSDYRVTNLNWVSQKENSIGTPRERIKTPEEIYQVFMILNKGITKELE
jgi:hypothetical protein